MKCVGPAGRFGVRFGFHRLAGFFRASRRGGMLDVQEDEGRLGTVVFDSGHGECGSPDETGDSETGHNKATDGTAGGSDPGGLDGTTQSSLARSVSRGQRLAIREV